MARSGPKPGGYLSVLQCSDPKYNRIFIRKLMLAEKPINSWAFSVQKRMQNYDSVIELKRQMNYNNYITFLSPLQGGKNEDAFET